jgi:hypothetical protein
MDKSFEDLFNSFYLKLTLLNYKYRSKIESSAIEQKFAKCLRLIIPIFNRLQENDNMTIEDVKNFSENSKEEYPFIDTFKNPSLKENTNVPTITTTTTTPTTEDSEDEDKEDPEGDKQIEELTKKSLAQLELIRQQAWGIVESSEENDETIESEDEDEEYVSAEDDTFENPLLTIPIHIDL